MYDVKVYDMATEANRQLSTHFQLHEFACTDGSKPVFLSQALVDILEAIRVHFGRPVTITSGYRTVSYNAGLKNSSKKSQHCNGLAADIKVEGHTAWRLTSKWRGIPPKRSTTTPAACWVTTAA